MVEDEKVVQIKPVESDLQLDDSEQAILNDAKQIYDLAREGKLKGFAFALVHKEDRPAIAGWGGLAKAETMVSAVAGLQFEMLYRMMKG